MNAYHRWLIRHNYFCEMKGCMNKSTEVVRYKGRDCCVCESHGDQTRPLEVGYRLREKLMSHEQSTLGDR